MFKYSRFFVFAAAAVAFVMPYSEAIAQDAVTPKTPVSADANYIFMPGQAMVSQDGRFRLVYQQNADLVLYQGTTKIWSANTYVGGDHKQANWGYSAGYLRFEGNGNLVVYNNFLSPAFTRPVWSSKTSNFPMSTINVQNDGNVTITSQDGRVRWSTNTCCR